MKNNNKQTEITENILKKSGRLAQFCAGYTVLFYTIIAKTATLLPCRVTDKWIFYTPSPATEPSSKLLMLNVNTQSQTTSSVVTVHNKLCRPWTIQIMRPAGD